MQGALMSRYGDAFMRAEKRGPEIALVQKTDCVGKHLRMSPFDIDCYDGFRRLHWYILASDQGSFVRLRDDASRISEDEFILVLHRV